MPFLTHKPFHVVEHNKKFKVVITNKPNHHKSKHLKEFDTREEAEAEMKRSEAAYHSLRAAHERPFAPLMYKYTQLSNGDVTATLVRHLPQGTKFFNCVCV
jgi:hypothetical protein